MEKNDEEILKDIMEQFEKIKNDAGIEPDEDYQRELEEMFGASIDEMNAEASIILQTQTIEIELVHEDAVFPSYNCPTDSGLIDGFKFSWNCRPRLYRRNKSPCIQC